MKKKCNCGKISKQDAKKYSAEKLMKELRRRYKVESVKIKLHKCSKITELFLKKKRAQEKKNKKLPPLFFREPKKKRTFDQALKEAMTSDGTIDMRKLKGNGSLGYNGGVACDVTDGPCACGAWHDSTKNK